MNARDFFRLLAGSLPSRQLRRGRARRLARVLRRDTCHLAPESLETRSMLSATIGSLATPATDGSPEPAAIVSTTTTPQTYTITWAWNENRTITNFNPATDKLALDWFRGSDLRLTDDAGSAVLAIPSMQQSYRLAGVPLNALTQANFTCKDPSATSFIAGVLAVPPPPITTPTPTPPPSLPPVSQAGTVTYQVTANWGSGFNGDVAVKNTGTSMLANWRVSFDFGGEISNIWNGEIVSRQGSTYTVKGASWNATVAPGASTTFGFTAGPGGANAVLRNLVIVGVTSTPLPEPPPPTPVPNPDPTPPPHDPITPTPPSESLGRVFQVNPADNDIVGFDPLLDQFDVGDVSVHNFIVGKLATGELAFVNPWAWTPEYQVVQGISFTDLSVTNFGIVNNEHLRQDIGGALSWELGVGPRDPGTVYVRSHEYGVHEVVEGFNPATTKLSFLYFGTRERLTVTDTADGLLISVEPSKQSVLLVGVAKADLVPGNVEFHHDQIIEDQLEVPFGFTAEQATLVSRMDLLTPQGPPGQATDGHQTSPGSMQPGHPEYHHDDHDHDHGDHDHGGMPADPPAESGYIDIASFGMSSGSSHTHLHDLHGGRTPITTEALVAYNGLRSFLGLESVELETVGQWAFDNRLTNNTQAWGNDLKGVGLWYSMQGAKVGWIRDAAFDPQIVADIQRTARLGDAADVLAMVEQFGHVGLRNYLAASGLEEAFINTLKMEPHYAGWMHDRCHGWRDIEGVAIAHDVNHLTVLSHDQMRPFMNDTFNWPQWPALEVSHDGVIEYFQSILVLGDPGGKNL